MRRVLIALALLPLGKVALGTPLPMPPELVARGGARASSGGHILYLDFDGATVTRGPACSSSTEMCSYVVKCESGTATVPPFSGTVAQRAAILTMVKHFYAPFAIDVVDERPAAGPHTVCIVGGQPTDICYEGRAAGVAPLDCSDLNGDIDVVFAFSDASHNDPHLTAVAIAQESAHSYGLEHTNAITDIMYPYLSGVEEGFLDSEMTVERSFGCRSDAQNSFLVLDQVLGPSPTRAADATAPTIRFLSPRQGQQGYAQLVAVRVEAKDDRGVRTVGLEVDEGTELAQSLHVARAPFDLDVMLNIGTHRLRVVATDAAGNSASAEVTIGVDGTGQTGSSVGPSPAGSPCEQDAQCRLACVRSGSAQGHCASPCDGRGCMIPGHVCVDYYGNGARLCLPPSLLTESTTVTPPATNAVGCGAAGAPVGSSLPGWVLAAWTVGRWWRRRRG